MMRRIGVIGAGLMGAGMASCLLRTGHPVIVLANRNRAPIDALVQQGATEADSAETLVQTCDVVLTCLPKADTVLALANQLVPMVRPDQVWIDTTSSTPEASITIANMLAAQGAIFADAPVTGGPPQASSGELASLVGCAEAHFPLIQSLVQPYSKVVRRFGDPGRGHAAKLLNNLVTQGTMILLADAYGTAHNFGIDTSALYDVMMTGAGRSGTLEKAVKPALQGDYGGSRFSIENAAKDLGYARDLIAGFDPDTAELAAQLHNRLATLIDKGRGADYVSTMLDPTRADQKDT
ncbi:MAG: NAD(P)-dependent oxidoreductase [Marivita sp.]|uniref:NAD(P)-dependent oxidoreductase n=1 Tax=Marivita sp. TaxID=2003365 RepID=UPI003EF15257